MKTDQPVRATYGIDAPHAVRNMFLGGIASIATGLALRRIVASARSIWITVLAICGGICLLLSGGLIAATSLITKRIVYRQLIDALHLRGDENMLDVGCGRGMLLIEAAKHLPNGQITGIDLWIEGD